MGPKMEALQMTNLAQKPALPTQKVRTHKTKLGHKDRAY